MKRREFLRKVGFSAAIVATPMFVPRSVFSQGDRPGANDRLGIAGIGVGRQGAPVLATVLKDPRTQGVCVCDVWNDRARDVAKKHRIKDYCQDFRHVLDRADVDAIVTATPEHWRSLICVNAALGGKHLYVEKPVTLTIDDGKRMREAARKTGVKVQCGSMQRSYLPNYLGCQFIREGHLGRITEIISANYESPWLCHFPGEEIPANLDWNMWCGPVEPVPFHPELFVPRGKPGWLSFRPFSGGEMTGWGTHGFDQIQCALGNDLTGPVEIRVAGEKLIPPTYDVPEEKRRGDELCSQPELSFRYKEGPLVKLSRVADWNSGIRGGGIFVGEKGTVEITRNRFVSDPPELAENWMKEHAEIKLPSHETDWINCIYSGATPIGELETGIRTASICHILNIARYLGRNLTWDAEQEMFCDDTEANTWLKREHRKGFELPSID
ncbi:MAG: Gfo/Idh/MocA family protein [Thermoguttaceae bacterium]